MRILYLSSLNFSSKTVCTRRDTVNYTHNYQVVDHKCQRQKHYEGIDYATCQNINKDEYNNRGCVLAIRKDTDYFGTTNNKLDLAHLIAFPIPLMIASFEE